MLRGRMEKGGISHVKRIREESCCGTDFKPTAFVAYSNLTS